MINKLVSIIIPTYNRGNVIRETITSVLNQTYQNFQIFIIDDGSNDETTNIVQSFNDKRIKYIFQTHSGLPAKGRNTGLKKIKGEYVAFLDSDDIWFPRKLEIQINLFEKNPNILLIATNGVLFPTKLNMKVIPLKKNIKISFKQLLEKNIIINSSVLFKKEVISMVGLLDENINLKYGEDFDYWLRILRFKDKSILIIKNILVKYRENTESLFNLYNSPYF
ncbi:MAG: glycosyltransferase family 2 protein, partial [Promethearchaeota archaeon]